MLALEVQWLKELLDQEQWDKVLQAAEQCLRRGGYSAAEYAEINYAICRARAFRQELLQAIPPGELARRLSRDTGQWDLLGKTLLVLGVAYWRTRSYDRALSTLYGFFEHNSHYTTAQTLAARVWHNIGHTLIRTGQAAEAAGALRRACNEYQSLNDVDGFTAAAQHLVECCVETSLPEARTVLAAMRATGTQHPSQYNGRAVYFLGRARCARQVGAFKWAAALCLAALAEERKSLYIEFHSNLVLSGCLAALGDNKNALGHALAARMIAANGKIYDLEFMAIEAMYDLMSGPDNTALQALDADYLEQGLDMTPFFGASSLPERMEA